MQPENPSTYPNPPSANNSFSFVSHPASDDQGNKKYKKILYFIPLGIAGLMLVGLVYLLMTKKSGEEIDSARLQAIQEQQAIIAKNRAAALAQRSSDTSVIQVTFTPTPSPTVVPTEIPTPTLTPTLIATASPTSSASAAASSSGSVQGAATVRSLWENIWIFVTRFF